MDFKKATDGLFDRVDYKALAKALGTSVATVRQARLKPEARAHRKPPSGWESSVIRLAEQRVFHYRKLIERIRAEREEPKK